MHIHGELVMNPAPIRESLAETPEIPSRRRLRLTVMMGAALLLALIALGAAVNRPGPERPDMTEPLVVSTLAARWSPGYVSRSRFVGRVEAARESQVGFELGGRVAAIAVDDGDRVTRGDVLARLDTERLEAQRGELVAALEETRAGLELAELTRERHREALELDAVSHQAFDEADRGLAARRAAVARVDASIRRIDVELAKSTLRAPFDAWVAARLVDEGQVVNAGRPLLHLLEARRPRARVGVAASAASELEVGQEATLEIGGDRFAALLDALLPVRGDATRSVDAVFELQAELGASAGSGASLRSGDLATLFVEREVDEEGVWLPRSSLTESSRGLWACFVAAPDDAGTGEYRIVRRELELLHHEGDRVFVRGTLAPGDLVVRDGRHRLVPGLAVLPEASARPEGAV
jgi:RND family efflux transporter MFP subunit